MVKFQGLLINLAINPILLFPQINLLIGLKASTIFGGHKFLGRIF